LKGWVYITGNPSLFFAEAAERA